MKRSTFALCLLVLALAVAPAEASVLDTIKNAFGTAWNTVLNAFTGLTQAVECRAVDWTVVSLDTCLAATSEDLCPPSCRTNLQRLRNAGEPCIDRLLRNVYATGNATVYERQEAQLTACNITFSPQNAAVPCYAASVLLPLAVVGASAVVLELLHP